MIFYHTIHPLQDLLTGLRDAVAAHPKFDRESGVDCPNAILVLLIHIQELWMDIMPPTLIYSFSLLTAVIQRSTRESIKYNVAVRKEGNAF